MTDFLARYEPRDPAWSLAEDTGRPGSRNNFEALFTQANGYLGLRAINEDRPAGSRPGTFLAGLFDRSECVAVEMVNLPDPLPFSLAVAGEKLDLDGGVESHRRSLDFAAGELFRETVYQDRAGRRTRLRTLRFVSRRDPNIVALKAEVTALDHAEEIIVHSEVDGSVTNAFASYFPDERMKHANLERINDNFDPDLYLQVRTRERRVAVAFAARLEACLPAGTGVRQRRIYGERVVESLAFKPEKGKPVTLVKLVAVADGRTVPGGEAELETFARNQLSVAALRGFDELRARNRAAWTELWADADVRVEADDEKLMPRVRFNIYQLLLNGSEVNYRHGIGIKGFTGEMYRGHYFWDTEMYLFPFYLYTNPAAARNLLVFRHRILDAARANAKSRGAEGALYNWEVDDSGREGINPEMNRTTGEKRRRETLDQLHINLDVIYAILSYYRATGDWEYLASYGLEIMVENARYWASTDKLVFNSELNAYETIDVMGPDEYHANVDNNYYTNRLLAWCLQRTLALLDEDTPRARNARFKVFAKLGVAAGEPERWRELAGKIHLPPAKDGVLEQFSGYFDLEDYEVTEYNEHGIPVVTELEHLKDPSHPDYVPTLTHFNEALVRMAKKHRMIKQADVLLTLNQFAEEIPREVQEKTLAFYEPRTLHFSSLSPGVYALCAARLGDMKLAWKHFNIALVMDLEDVKKEAGKALHTPTSGEVYTILTAGFAGLRPRGAGLELDPHLPDGWRAIEFRSRWQGAVLDCRVEPGRATVTVNGNHPVVIHAAGKEHRAQPGRPLQLKR